MGGLSSVKTYRHWAFRRCPRQMQLCRNGTKLKPCDAPADVTVARGSRSRDNKKAIKNGTSARLFTAPSALFDVSLYFDLSDSPEPFRPLRCARGRRKKKPSCGRPRAQQSTHERHHKMVMTFSANSYTTFCAFSGAVLGESIYCAKVDEI